MFEADGRFLTGSSRYFSSGRHFVPCSHVISIVINDFVFDMMCSDMISIYLPQYTHTHARARTPTTVAVFS